MPNPPFAIPGAIRYGLLSTEMEIHVNGGARDLPEATTIVGLLTVLGLSEVRVAVEVNRQVIPRARHAETELRAGDRVEIVQFVGGG